MFRFFTPTPKPYPASEPLTQTIDLRPRRVIMWVGGINNRQQHDNVTPKPFGPERANEIEREARSKARFGPWEDQLDKTYSPEEKAYVLAVWNTMPGNTALIHAFLRIKNNDI